MKHYLLLFLLSWLSAATAQAQASFFSADFENGSLAPLTGVGATNRWVVTTAAGNGPSGPGTQAAHVSNNGTAYWASYQTAGATHLYVDVTFPTTGDAFDLSFDWQCTGGRTTTWEHYLQVFLVPTTSVPTVGVPLPVASAISPRYAGGVTPGFQQAYVTLPNRLNLRGTTQRLVFTWINSTQSGYEPAAIDNLVLRQYTTAPLAGTYTVDGNLATGGRNFRTLPEAIAAWNLSVVTGPVTFDVAAGQTFSGSPLRVLATGTVTQPLLVRKNGPGANPKLLAATGEAAIDVIGADYVTFDGLDVQAQGNGPQCGYRVQSAPMNGARNIVIRNATITLNRTAPNNYYGVIQRGGFDNDPDAINQHILYDNLLITNARSGMYIIGGYPPYLDKDIEISHVTVGNGSLGDIGSNGATGIHLENLDHALIHDNIIQGLQSNNGELHGIFTRWLFGTSSAPTRIYNNKIRNLHRANAYSFQMPGTTGLYIWTVLHNTVWPRVPANVHVYNNDISDLRMTFGGASAVSPNSPDVCGIRVKAQGETGDTILLAHNSVHLDASAFPNVSLTNLYVEHMLDENVRLLVRNNIFSNTTSAQSGTARHSALYMVIPTLTGYDRFDRNDYYIPNATNGLIGTRVSGIFTTDYVQLQNWRSAWSQGSDANGVDVAPLFTGSDLRPSNAALDNLGVRVNGISADITGAVRHATRPDLGAYEFNGTMTAAATTRPGLQLAVWPVPFADELCVGGVADNLTVQVELLNALGQVSRRTTGSAGAAPLRLTGLRALPAGSYLLRLRTADGRSQTVHLQH